MLLPTVLTLLAAAPAPAPPPPEVGIPFACGRIHAVSQGHDTGSHLSNDTYAWDFRMPEGTPIVAARKGTVRMARGDSNQGGCNPKMAPMANYVVISHGDGLETQYLHFSAVLVSVGEPVEEGQLLGYSGATGWACGAHLHFKVAREASRSWNNPSVPATLAGYGDPVRETMIASSPCRDTVQPLLTVRPPNAAPPEQPQASSQDQASGGIPSGTESPVDGPRPHACDKGVGCLLRGTQKR